MRKEPAFTISPARYAKGCVEVCNTSDGSGLKSRVARLCEALGARWTNRGHAYILRASQGPILQALHAAGWDAAYGGFANSPILLESPDGREMTAREARKAIARSPEPEK